MEEKKALRRVGLRQRRPPAAGGGWLAVPCGGQGRKRPALGEPFGPGKSGIPFAPIFAAAGRLLMKALARGKATASASAGQRVATAQPLAALPLTDAACPLRASGTRGKRSWSNTSLHPDLRCTAPREPTIKPVPYPAAPVGQSSQTRRHHLTPIPVQQLCTYVQSCDQKWSFLLDRARPVFFSTRWKRKWGVHPRWTSLPAGADTPPAAATVALPASDPNLSLRISE